MKQWVLSVAGIAVLSVVADVILPVGQTRKYVKTVIGIVVSLVVAQPILQLFGRGISLDAGQEVAVQQQYLDWADQTRQGDVVGLQMALVQQGFSSPKVTYNAKTQCYNVVLKEQKSDELVFRAQKAAQAAKCLGAVQYSWNNSG